MVPIVGLVPVVQNRAVNTMILWFPDAKWTPVSCCLADHPDFLVYMNLVENTAKPWFKAFRVCGELGLNNIQISFSELTISLAISL